MSPRLAYVCLQATREGQASHAHVHEIISGLEARGWVVDVYEPSYAGTVTAHVRYAQKISEFVSVQLTFAARAKDYDVIYVRDHPAALPSILAARHSGRPIVLEVNGPYEELYLSFPWTRHFAWLVRAAFRARASRSAAVITVTTQLADWLGGRGPRVAVDVVPNGADPNRFKPSVRPVLGAAYAVFVGALAPWQGLETLIAAARSSLWPSTLELRIAGVGAQEQLARTASEEIPHVNYLGLVPFRQVPLLLAESSMALIPKNDLGDRRTTGLSPLKLYEAMSCGTPVIVTDIPGQAETVREANCGLVVPPGDHEALARACAVICGNPAAAAEMGRRGREAVLEKYSWDHSAALTNTILRRVLDQHF